MDKGISIAREMAEEQRAYARKARAEEREQDASAHDCAARALHAISATSGTVSNTLAFSWAGEERDNQRKSSGPHSDESGYTATILENLGIAIRSRVVSQ